MGNNDLIKCAIISVDCTPNDPVDIRCGGPEYLGFDFYIKEEQIEEMRKFIALTIEGFKIPLTNLYISGTITLDEKNVWTKERIVKVIRDNAEYLQNESKKNYNVSFKK